MGWYGDTAICPNCKCEDEEKVACQFHNDMVEHFYLACSNCGLKLYAKRRVWKIDTSYIDKSIIGKHINDIDFLEEINRNVDNNENIIEGFLDYPWEN